MILPVNAVLSRENVSTLNISLSNKQTYQGFSNAHVHNNPSACASFGAFNCSSSPVSGSVTDARSLSFLERFALLPRIILTPREKRKRSSNLKKYEMFLRRTMDFNPVMRVEI